MSELDDTLISINARGITGSRSGTQEQFRTDFRLIDFGRFGKLPTEIVLKLSSKTSNFHFNYLQPKPSSKLKIKVGTSFEIKKKIDFDELNLVIEELYTIYGIVGSEYLSSYSELSKSDKIVANNLYPLLIRSLFDNMVIDVKKKSENQSRFSIDLCHPSNIVAFYGADYYELTERIEKGKHELFAATDDKEQIYSLIQKRAFEKVGETDFFKYRAYIQGVRIKSMNQGKVDIVATFIQHISAEFTLLDLPYFLIDKKWYKLKGNFIDQLNNRSQKILSSLQLEDGIFDINWDTTTITKEADYNNEYLGLKNYFVLDKRIVDGIELCDVLYYTRTKLFLIHVCYQQL